MEMVISKVVNVNKLYYVKKQYTWRYNTSKNPSMFVRCGTFDDNGNLVGSNMYKYRKSCGLMFLSRDDVFKFMKNYKIDDWQIGCIDLNNEKEVSRYVGNCKLVNYKLFGVDCYCLSSR